MDASRWERVKELFDQALQKEPAQRDAFLNQACSGDEALRQEVGSLLAAYQEADSSIATPGDMIEDASEPPIVGPPHRRLPGAPADRQRRHGLGVSGRTCR